MAGDAAENGDNSVCYGEWHGARGRQRRPWRVVAWSTGRRSSLGISQRLNGEIEYPNGAEHGGGRGWEAEGAGWERDKIRV
jgi:hypothetical protein